MTTHPKNHLASSSQHGPTVASGNAAKPETFRLPKRGGDPHFGLSRAWYYQAEQKGLLKLIRLRDRGKLRGVTLVPYDDVAKLIAEARGQ